MTLDADTAYRALQERDARFDGRLFIGVTSTGVYCRPVCRVRIPRRENCRFFGTRAQAEGGGFRPCLKCRPEIAPGLSLMDSSQALAGTAAQWIEQAVQRGEAIAVPGMAARLGITDRHLRRIFVARHGVAPRDYLATQRLLLAKQLLTDTAQPVTQVASASGFDSVRRFNAAFAARYRLAPTRLRRALALPASAPSVASVPSDTLRLAYRPPFDIAGLLGFFGRRALPGLEVVDATGLRRTLRLVRHGEPVTGWIRVRFVAGRHEVQVDTSPSFGPLLGEVLHRVRHAFDLDADPALVDPALATVPAPWVAGLRLPGSLCGFETAVRVVLGQQVTVKAAKTLVQRLVARFGDPVQTPFDDLDRLFPTAKALAAADPAAIGTLGIVRQRVAAVQALSAEVAAGRIGLHPGAPVGPTLAALRALPGIGDWTAQVVAMRALGWADAWPATDIGLMNALGSRDAKVITAAAEPWRPWRGYAVMQLWHHVENNPTTRR